MKSNTIVRQTHQFFNRFLMLDVQLARSIYLLMLNLKTKVKHYLYANIVLPSIHWVEENTDMRCLNNLNGVEVCHEQVIFHNFIELIQLYFS